VTEPERWRTVSGVAERERISSGSPWELIVGYSRAIVVGDRLFIAGTAPQWPDGLVDPDPAVQMRRCLEIIGNALRAAGSGFEDVVRTRIYLVDARDFEVIGQVHGEVFRDIRPANTTVVVAGLLDPNWRVEVEAEAVLGAAIDS
jgi:enamine deaminase RidA (YjgF/YER057c/UK114 family)